VVEGSGPRLLQLPCCSRQPG